MSNCLPSQTNGACRFPGASKDLRRDHAGGAFPCTRRIGPSNKGSRRRQYDGPTEKERAVLQKEVELVLCIKTGQDRTGQYFLVCFVLGFVVSFRASYDSCPLFVLDPPVRPSVRAVPSRCPLFLLNPPCPPPPPAAATTNLSGLLVEVFFLTSFLPSFLPSLFPSSLPFAPRACAKKHSKPHTRAEKNHTHGNAERHAQCIQGVPGWVCTP